MFYMTDNIALVGPNLISQNPYHQEWSPIIHLAEFELTTQYQFCLSLNRQILSPAFRPQARFLVDADKLWSQLLRFARKDKSWRWLNLSLTSNLCSVGSWKEYDNPDITSISKRSSAPSRPLPHLDRGCWGYEWSTSLWLFRLDRGLDRDSVLPFAVNVVPAHL